MLAWVVMNRQHLPRAARGPANPFFLPPRFPFWVSPLPPLRKNHPFPFIHLRGTHFATLLFSNSYMEWRGCTPLGVSSAYPLPLIPACPEENRGIPFLFTFLRTLPHSFALAQNSTLFFSTVSALFGKNTGGGGGGEPLCCRRILLRMQPPQHQARKKKWDRHESLSHKS